MSDLFTIINLPGLYGGGIAERKKLTRAAIIQLYRDHAARLKDEAEKILAASDDQFNCRIVRGIYVQHLVKQL